LSDFLCWKSLIKLQGRKATPSIRAAIDRSDPATFRLGSVACIARQQAGASRPRHISTSPRRAAAQCDPSTEEDHEVVERSNANMERYDVRASSTDTDRKMERQESAGTLRPQIAPPSIGALRYKTLDAPLGARRRSARDRSWRRRIDITSNNKFSVRYGVGD